MSSNENKEPEQKIAKLCVFCGSSPGNKDIYMDAARDFGAEMAKRGIGLVYGGGNIGIMGAVARSVKEGGESVLGVIPKSLAPREVAGDFVGETIIVDGMHSRKAKMAENAHAFVALPGGFGTMEELFEVITWQQLGIHRKPIGVLNVDSYYDPLREFIDHSVAAGFVGDKFRNIVIFANTSAELIDALVKHEPPQSDIQWLSEDQT
jgi:cytokinin riboside 5'-monophosphate phosphoribohydrolase